MQNKIVLVTGTSGTGKSTLLRSLTKKGVSAIGIDEETRLTYWINKDGSVFEGATSFDKDFLDNHDWICDIALLQSLIQKQSGTLVIAGSCDNILEVMKLCDSTLILHCPPEVFLQRIDERTDNDFGKSEAAKAALLGYYEEYFEDCKNAGAIAIDACQSPEEVLQSVLSYLEYDKL